MCVWAYNVVGGCASYVKLQKHRIGRIYFCLAPAESAQWSPMQCDLCAPSGPFMAILRGL